jgi:hypothetical protein
LHMPPCCAFWTRSPVSQFFSPNALLRRRCMHVYILSARFSAVQRSHADTMLRCAAAAHRCR